MLALVRWLPPEAALWHDELGSWTVERELAAAHLELTHSLLVLTARAHGAKRRDVPKPLRVPRPGQPVSRPLSGVAAILAVANPSR